MAFVRLSGSKIVQQCEAAELEKQKEKRRDEIRQRLAVQAEAAIKELKPRITAQDKAIFDAETKQIAKIIGEEVVTDIEMELMAATRQLADYSRKATPMLEEMRETSKRLARFRGMQQLLRGRNVRELISQIAVKHAVPREMLFKQHGILCKVQPIAHARQEVYYQLRKLGISYPRIGMILGGIDHTSVTHGVEAHCARSNLRHPDRPAGRSPPETSAETSS